MTGYGAEAMNKGASWQENSKNLEKYRRAQPCGHGETIQRDQWRKRRVILRLCYTDIAKESAIIKVFVFVFT